MVVINWIIDKGYEVHEQRRSSSLNTQRIDHLYEDPHKKKSKTFYIMAFNWHTKSIKNNTRDQTRWTYNLGAQSHAAVSFESPEYTVNSDAIGTLRILEAIKNLVLKKQSLSPAQVSYMA